MIWFVMSAWGLTIVGLAAALLRIDQMNREVRSVQSTSHDECLNRIVEATSNRVVAQAFRTAASDWDSIEEQSELRRLAQEKYQPGGPSMPAIWMRERADRLVARLPDEYAIYNLNRERVL